MTKQENVYAYTDDHHHARSSRQSFKMTGLSSSREQNDQHEPLLSSSSEGEEQTSNDPTTRFSSSLHVFRRNAFKTDARTWTVQVAGVAFVGLLWGLVFTSMPLAPLPLFGYHPLIQSFTFLLLLQAIVTLQPTSHENETEKRTGFHVHRLINLFLVVPLFTVGASIMWYLHDQPGAGHFISWHGILGTVAVVWTWLQVTVGVLITLPSGMSLIGGESRAKALYKWHRASGYALALLFALTLFLGAAQTSWAAQNASQLHSTFVALTLSIIVGALFIRIQWAKLPRL